MKIEPKKFLSVLLKKIRFLLLIVSVGGIVIDIFSNRHSPDLIIFTLIAAWLGTIFGWGLEANFSFFGALIFLIVGQVAGIFQKVPVDYYSPAEKAALWVYVFFVIAVIKRTAEFKKPLAQEIKFLDIARLFLGKQEREKSINVVKEWSLNKQAIVKEGLLVGKSESQGYLGIIKKWLLDKQTSIKEFLFFGRQRSEEYQKLIEKWSIDGRRGIINTAGFIFEILTLRIKEALVLFKGSINIFFLQLKRFVTDSAVILYRFFLKEVGRLLDFSSSTILQIAERKYLLIRKTRYFQNLSFVLVNLPILHLIIIFFILRKLVIEVKFYNFFFKEIYIGQLFSRVIKGMVVLWLVVALVAGVFFVLRPRINKVILGLGIKRRALRLSVNIFLFWFGLGPIRKEKLDVSGLLLKNFRPERGRWLYLAVFLWILYWGDKWIFLKERDKFEFRPYITEVYYDIASRYSYINILGHNFKEMPFRGRVFISGNEQRIVEWGDKKVVVEIDPILSKSGELRLVNDYGFGKDVKSNVVEFTYFDSRSSSPDDEKRFWETLKEITKIRSKLYEESF